MLKYGFFDSINGDRKYNSRDVAEMFNGIIADGIYAQIGERFSVDTKKVIEMEEDKMTVTVGTGQAWLNHTKIINTSKLELVLSEAIGANRYDAIIVEVNDNSRQANIFVKPNVQTKTETVATSFDLRPGQLINTEFVHQHLLAVILVEGGATKIKPDNIASKIGFASPGGIPYVTCPLDSFPADETLKQWVAQWYSFLNDSDEAFETAQNDRLAIFNGFVNDWNTWFAYVRDDLDGYYAGKIEEHNISPTAHLDMRNAINTLITRLNTLANSDDETLDQMSEVVAFIKQNRESIQFLTGVAEGAVLNSKTQPGYVSAGGNNYDMVWGTDASGNPKWRYQEIRRINDFDILLNELSLPVGTTTTLQFLTLLKPGVYFGAYHKGSLSDDIITTAYYNNFFVFKTFSNFGKLFIAPTYNSKNIYMADVQNGIWGDLSSHFDDNGVLPIANGGTGKTTAVSGFSNLLRGLTYYGGGDIETLFIPVAGLNIYTVDNVAFCKGIDFFNYIMSKVRYPFASQDSINGFTYYFDYSTTSLLMGYVGTGVVSGGSYLNNNNSLAGFIYLVTRGVTHQGLKITTIYEDTSGEGDYHPVLTNFGNGYLGIKPSAYTRSSGEIVVFPIIGSIVNFT